MISTTTDAVRFVLPMFDADDPQAPAFFLRAGNVNERQALEAELAGDYRAGRVYDFELAACFAEGITELMAGDPGRDALLSLIEAETNLGAGERLPAAERQMLAQAREILSEHWPEYRALMARANRRAQFKPLVAFRRFCIGWEHVPRVDNAKEPAMHAIGVDRLVTLDAVAQLTPLWMQLAGNRAYDLLYPEDQEKNSAAPSKSDDGQGTSNLGAE
ncbi:hypothetical protein HY78_14505 [Rhizorhabdus wittichii DC-6]|nr:hypothetical protein HY78_14505 [Rhizorhabdus wittichii DC-6]